MYDRSPSIVQSEKHLSSYHMALLKTARDPGDALHVMEPQPIARDDAEIRAPVLPPLFVHVTVTAASNADKDRIIVNDGITKEMIEALADASDPITESDVPLAPQSRKRARSITSSATVVGDDDDTAMDGDSDTNSTDRRKPPVFPPDARINTTAPPSVGAYAKHQSQRGSGH